MPDSNTFSFFTPIELRKSDDGKSQEMRFKGVASVYKEDTEGELLDPKGFIIDQFKWVNWEHSSAPENQIGVVNSAVITDQDLTIEGQLFPNNPQAVYVYNLAKSLEDINSTVRLGLSIEGKIEQRDAKNPKKVLKARIFKVAICTTPINPLTFMELMKSNFKKSNKNTMLQEQDEVKQAFERLGVKINTDADLQKSQSGEDIAKGEGEGDGESMMSDMLEFISTLLSKNTSKDKIMKQLTQKYSDASDEDREMAYEKACSKIKKSTEGDNGDNADANANANQDDLTKGASDEDLAKKFIQSKFEELSKSITNQGSDVAKILSALWQEVSFIKSTTEKQAQVLENVSDEVNAIGAMPALRKSFVAGGANTYKKSPYEDKADAGENKDDLSKGSKTGDAVAGRTEKTERVLRMEVPAEKKLVIDIVKAFQKDGFLKGIKPSEVESGRPFNDDELTLIHERVNVKIVNQSYL